MDAATAITVIREALAAGGSRVDWSTHVVSTSMPDDGVSTAQAEHVVNNADVDDVERDHRTVNRWMIIGPLSSADDAAEYVVIVFIRRELSIVIVTCYKP